MHFEEPGKPLSRRDIAAVERELGLSLPVELVGAYLRANGGGPEPYVFEHESADTIVAKFLPLISDTDHALTSVEVYEDLVLEQRVVPENFFPFAVDGGGDFFFVDLETGIVHFYRADGTPSLIRLDLGVEEFWASLKPEHG